MELEIQLYGYVSGSGEEEEAIREKRQRDRERKSVLIWSCALYNACCGGRFVADDLSARMLFFWPLKNY